MGPCANRSQSLGEDQRAIPDEAATALDYLRFVLGSWNARRPEAEQVADCVVKATNMPTAAEYAVALHTADMLAFMGAKLDMLYAGMMHSMPVYRLYPATPEREAVELWWPLGASASSGRWRPSEAVEGPQEGFGSEDHHGYASAGCGAGGDAKDRHQPHDGATSDSADTDRMRLARQRKAEALLRQGVTKAEVTRSVVFRCRGFRRCSRAKPSRSRKPWMISISTFAIFRMKTTLSERANATS